MLQYVPISVVHISRKSHQSLLLNDETTKQECDLVPRPLTPGWVTSSGYNFTML